MKLQGSIGRTSYGEVVILDTSEVQDEIEYGGMLYELEKLGIRDGKAYQISNNGIILMYRDAREKSKKVSKNLG